MKHEWKGGMTPSTPDNPPEGYSYCNLCGVEETDDNRDEECPPLGCVGDEIFERLHTAKRADYKHALTVVRRLADPSSAAQVTDEELSDATFEFAMRLDIVSPLLPLVSTMLERFMRLTGIEETPRGLRADYFSSAAIGDSSDSNP